MNYFFPTSPPFFVAFINSAVIDLCKFFVAIFAKGFALQKLASQKWRGITSQTNIKRKKLKQLDTTKNKTIILKLYSINIAMRWHAVEVSIMSVCLHP